MKYLVAVFLLAMSIQSFGQFTKGDKVLGGSLNWNLQPDRKGDERLDKFCELRIKPTFGIMLTEDIEVGGLFGYRQYKSKTDYSDGGLRYRKSNDLTPGIYAQKHFPLTENFFFTIRGETSYSVQKSTTTIENIQPNAVTEDETKSRSMNVNFDPGFLFFPLENLALRGSLGGIGYTHSRNKTTNTRQNSFSARYGSIYLGLYYYFKTKKE